MIHSLQQTHAIPGHDGTDLYFRHIPAPNERCRVVVSHGLGEHSGRYTHVTDLLHSLGASVWIHDHRGHGRSQGKRGHVDHFDDYVSDLEIMLATAGRRSAKGTPLLLLGHSMGGLVALSFARRYPGHVDGIIVSSPLLGVLRPLPPIIKAFVQTMAVIWPAMPLNNRVDATFVSHDAAEVDAYRCDSLVHDRISARWAVSCVAEIAATGSAPEALQEPVLMQIAGADGLVSAPAALDYYKALEVADKTLCYYPDLYHELYNEKRPQRDKVLNDLKQWVADRFL